MPEVRHRPVDVPGGDARDERIGELLAEVTGEGLEGLLHLLLSLDALPADLLPVVDQLARHLIESVVVGEDGGIELKGAGPLLDDRAVPLGDGLQDGDSLPCRRPGDPAK